MKVTALPNGVSFLKVMVTGLRLRSRFCIELDPLQSRASQQEEGSTDRPRRSELPPHRLKLAAEENDNRPETEPAGPNGREDELVEEGQRRGHGFHRLARFCLTSGSSLSAGRLHSSLPFFAARRHGRAHGERLVRVSRRYLA